MQPAATARFALRAATAGDHDAVDRAFAGFALDDRDQYRAFLQAQADAHLPVEAGIDRIDLSRELPDWAERRRASLLIADLAELGAAVAPAGEPPVYQDTAAALGAAYVLEGSRLGGRMLARAVPDTLPRRFLDAGDSSLWRKLVEALDQSLVSPAQLAVAADAARAVFARFEASARSHRKDIHA